MKQRVSHSRGNVESSRQIERLAREKIEVFTGSIRADGTYKDPIYLSARSTGLHLASGFGRRFLVELVQNAYDAHPREESSGEIRILFAPDEGPNGALYVANRGCGFRWSNVEALCSIGLSDKPIGETIGNKGLGFRSVLYVSAEPHVYSRLSFGPADRFDGYCFRFAGPGDFDRWIEDPVQRELAERDLPPFHIPVPTTDCTDTVWAFARDGFATVIRLPLQSRSAHDTVRDEIEALRKSPAPLLLFLRRLSTLQVVVDGEPEHSFCLTRSSKVVHLGDDAETHGNEYTCVDLGGGQRYFVAWRWVPEDRVKRAIDSSIEQKQLHPSWSGWQGNGELAIAVRLDDGPLTPLLYTFLPMGDGAEAPFHGYLHGSFYPKPDRTSLHADIPINVLYIREAVRLCASTILALRQATDQPEAPISREAAGKLIIDLLCWERVRSIESEDGWRFPALMQEAFAALGCNFAEADILPVVQSSGGACWARPDEVWRWDRTDLKAFGVKTLVALADVAVLPPDLGAERLDRLVSFIEEVDDALKLAPTNEDLADAIERIASALWRSNAATDKWRDFYLELKPVLEGRFMDLHGRKILLCKDGVLRQAATHEAEPVDLDRAGDGAPKKRGRRRRKPTDVAIFSPSKRYMDESSDAYDAGEVLQIPAELSGGFAFLTDELEWYDEIEMARHFLEESKLVRAYDGEELVAHVSSVVRNDSRKRVRRAALAWVFRLYRASQASRPISLRRAKLFVPTLNGEWIDAREAIFSAGWPASTLGNLTDDFLAQTATHADDLRQLRDRRLASPNAKSFSQGHAEEWVNFLTAIGVKKGIQPVRRESRNFRISGYALSAASVCDRLGLGEQTLRYWQRDIEETGKHQVYQSSQHELDGSLWYMPGQEKHDSFSPEARVLFAQLILKWLTAADPECLRLTFFAPTARHASRFEWPTPLAAFLHQAAWFPVEISDGLHSRWEFQKPMDVWLPNEGETDRLPPYMPQIPRKLRRIISEQATLAERLGEWCKANFLNAPASLSRQAEFLGRLFATPGIDRYYLKPFTNLYYDTWRRLAADGATLDWDVKKRPHYLVARYKGSFSAVAVYPTKDNESDADEAAREGDEQQDVFVRDTDDTLAAVLMDAMGFHVFDAGAQNAAGVASLLRGLLESRFRALSEVRVSLLVDGEEYTGRVGEEDFLINHCPWLSALVCLAMESLTGPAAQRLPADRGEILDRLHRIQLHLVKTVKFNVNEKVIDLPASHYGALAFGDKNRPTLILVDEHGSLDWSALRRAATPLTQLLEHTDLASALKVAFFILEGLDEPVSGPLPADTRLVDLCRELHVDPYDAANALEVLGSNIRRLVRLLRPVVHYFTGVSGVEIFTTDVAHANTIHDLTIALVPHLAETGYTIEAVITACKRAVGFGDVRDELNLPFGEFNESLKAVDEEPDIYREAHIDAVSTFVADNRNKIMDCLRRPFVELFRDRLSLDGYVRLRGEINEIAPKDEWLLAYKVPDSALITSLVDEWLTQRGAPAIGVDPTELPPWSDVRRDNKSRINRFIQAHGNTIRACCHKQRLDLPDSWKNLSTAGDQLFKSLDDLGALDFGLLDEQNLIAWLAVARAWPPKMRPTVELTALGLTAADVDDERDREREAKRQREREARSIEFNGRLIDPHEVDPDVLASEIEANLPKELAATKLGQVVDLRLMPERKQGRKGGRTGGRNGGSPKSNSDKNDLIGFLGECAVYYWLKKQLLQQDIDAAWVSGYRSRLLPGDGDDGLGYDFKVRYRNQHWHLEVKSRIGDPQEFELRESEVRFARDCARKRGCEYRIVYVSNLQDTSTMRVELLPNPMSEEGRRQFQIGGQGIRYKFARGR